MNALVIHRFGSIRNYVRTLNDSLYASSSEHNCAIPEGVFPAIMQHYCLQSDLSEASQNEETHQQLAV
jgi:hypothetical protein